MNYAKLENGEIVFAPRKLRDGETIVYNPPEALLREHGYKPVQETEAPTVEPGFIAVPGWSEEDDEIVQTWTVEEQPITEEEALVRYANEITGAEDETLIEATETLIKLKMEE